MNLKKLSEPFEANEIEWRIGRSGTKSGGDVWALALAYLTARQVHDRLDDVVGPENWRMSYREHKGGTICRIGIRIEGEWVFKEGGSDESNFEAFKGELSGAEKRAGVPWGVGRYLYNLDETFVETSLQKRQGWKYQSKSKNTPAFYWKNPSLPAWALPKKRKQTDSDWDKIEKTVEEEFAKPELPPTEENVKETVKAAPALRPLSPTKLKSLLLQKAGKYQEKGKTASGKQIGALPGFLSIVFENDVDRHAVTKWIWGQPSTQKLKGWQVLSMLDWLSPDKIDGSWVVSEDVEQEAVALLKHVVKEQGQEELL